MQRITAPRGVPDVLPPASELLEEIEAAARTIFDRYGYRRIETPVFEHTEAFVRTIGETTDIVSKEMYTFLDRSERSLTLRPEGTASVARAFVEHRLDGSEQLPLRLHYMGPMFRYERPQQGRTRQFRQIGIECLGSAAPVCDAETILVGAELFEAIGLRPRLLLNSMGCPTDRERFNPALREFLEAREEQLCGDCRQRAKVNPLRVFDCKNETCKAVLAGEGLPKVTDFLCAECKAHFDEVRSLLGAAGVEWTDRDDLVRGLDYYTRTVYEFDMAELGARSAVCGGGRYDGLVEQFGGPPTPAVGFAVGVVPTMVAIQKQRDLPSWVPQVYVIWLDDELSGRALVAARDLRAAGLRVTMSDERKSMRAQLRAADRAGAPLALILGTRDVERGVATVRDLSESTQEEIALDALVQSLQARFGTETPR